MRPLGCDQPETLTRGYYHHVDSPVFKASPLFNPGDTLIASPPFCSKISRVTIRRRIRVFTENLVGLRFL